MFIQCCVWVLLTLSPGGSTDLDTLWTEATTLLQERNYSAASQKWRELQERAPEAHVWRFYLHSLDRAGEYEAVISAHQSLPEGHPCVALGLSAYQHALLQLGYREALAELMGMSLQELDAQYERECRSSTAGSLYRRARIQAQHGEYSEAARLLRESRSTDPAICEAWLFTDFEERVHGFLALTESKGAH